MILALFKIPNLFLLILAFIVVALGIVFCSNKISRYIAAITEKSNIGGAFLGAFVLSLVTSIPELISGMTASLLDNPTLSYGNVIGVNMMTLTFLCILDIIFLKKQLFSRSKVSNTNRKTILYVFGFNVLMLICLFVPAINNFLTINIGFTKFSLIYFAMLVAYIIYIYRIYKLGNSENDEDAEPSGLDKLSLKQVVIRFFIFSILLICLSVLISSITDQMSDPIEEGGLGLGSAMAGALFLSVCTGLPEMTSAVSLAKMGQGNIALGGIIGSHFFNFIIFFVGDLFYSRCGTMQALYENNEQYMTIKLTVIVGMILNLLLFANTFKKVDINNGKNKQNIIKNKLVYILPCVIIITLYLVFWFTKSNIVELLMK